MPEATSQNAVLILLVSSFTGGLGSGNHFCLSFSASFIDIKYPKSKRSKIVSIGEGGFSLPHQPSWEISRDQYPVVPSRDVKDSLTETLWVSKITSTWYLLHIKAISLLYKIFRQF